MRLLVLALLLGTSLLLAGCGDGGGAPAPMAGGGAPPPPPGGPPAPPGAPGDAPPPDAPPADSPPPESPPAGDAGSAVEGGPTPTNPPGEGAPAEGTPDGALPPPGEFGPMPPTGSPDGTPPPEGAGDVGQPPGDNPDGTPRPPPPPRNLREQAIAAFRAGNDIAGYKFLCAHYIVMPQAKAELAKKMAWYPALFRPALAPRIGIAVHVIEEPKDFWGDPMPIGSASLTSVVQQLQQAEVADRRIGGERSVSRFRSGRPTTAIGEGDRGEAIRSAGGAEQLAHYTGDFGNLLIDALLDRIEGGDYGPALREIVQQGARPVQRADPNNPGGFAGGDGFATPGDGTETGAPGGGRGGRAGRGRLGASGGAAGVGPTGLPGDEGEGRSRRFTTRAEAVEAASLSQIKQIQPCIVWLGKESDRSEITKRAEVAMVDVLFIFEQTLRTSRTGNLTNNRLVLRVFTAKNNKPLPNYVPEALVNLDVEKWRQKNERGIDPVEREVLKAIEALDAVLKPVPLPEALTAERVKKRIDDLVAEKPTEPLPVLVEARFYAAKGLLPEAEVAKAAVALLGEANFSRLQARAADESE